jgi:hypothetical protein
MPPRQLSRFALSTAVPANVDASKIILSERVPYRYTVETDTIQHVVVAGDTLFTIAARYYASLDRPAGLWWVIADFQPEPIHDPTVDLTPGSLLYVPSLRLVQQEIFNERRRVTVSVGS